MPHQLTHGAVLLSGFAFAPPPPEVFDQPKLLPATAAGASEFSVQPLHAPLSPIALYPEESPTQKLRASAYPLPILAAACRFEERKTSA